MFRILSLTFAVAVTTLPAQAEPLTQPQLDRLHQTMDRCNHEARRSMLDQGQAMLCSFTYRMLADHFGDFATYADARAMRREGQNRTTSLF